MKKNDVWGRSVPINFIFLFRVMKLCFLFLVIFNLAVVAAGSAQVKRVSLTMENAELRQVFKKLKQQTGLRFFFNEEKLKREDVRQIDIQNLELDKALDKILEGTELTYIFLKDVVVIKDRQEDRVQAILKDKRLITGVVRDEKGISLPGVSVIVKGTQTGVATNVDGYFEIKVDDDPGLVLQFSFVGMKNKEMRIGDSYKLKIVLESAAENLDEVIVTGYQTISKERATGSYSVISAKEYENKLQDNILARIEGQVAGLVSYKNENTIRGVSTVYGNTDPLYVVDGMPYEGSLNAINPADVVNITVLKDATAASIYGARAANGVIVITTRKGKSGKMKLTYNGSVRFEPIPDLDYLDLMSGSELIDMQIEGFHYYHSEYGRLNKRVAINEIDELLYKHEANELTDDELAEQLAVYRNSDRKNQVKKELLRTAVKHQHNLSVSGGNETNRYLFSLNYLGDNPHEKFQKNNRIGFTLKDNLDLCGWLSVELGVSGSYTRNKGFNGISGLDLYQSGPSYRMLRDENGDAKVWDNYKSEYEIERLKSL